MTAQGSMTKTQSMDRVLGGDRELAGLTRSFGIASLVVLLGVGSAWLVVKRVGEAPDLQVDEVLVLSPWQQGRSGAGVQTLIEQAELAYAAGRITTPAFDSALYFFQAVLAEDPQQSQARGGLERVVEWLRGELAAAQQEGDLQQVEAVAVQIASLRPDDATAAERAQQARQALALHARADSALQSGDLAVAGRDFTALARIELAAVAASVGIERSIAAWVTRARTAANRGALEQARAAAAEAAALGADSSTQAALREVIAEASQQAGDHLLELRLRAAAQALEAGRLIGDDSAWDLYGSVLREHPDHAGAQAGLSEVRQALRQRIELALQEERFAAVPELLDAASSTGLPAAELRSLRQELDYREHLAAMRDGRFGEPLQISQLQLLRERAPLYPRQAVSRGIEGWADVEFTVTATGEVADVAVVASSASVFHGSTIDAIEGYRFEPYQLHGRPVPVRASLRFNYRM